MNVKEKLFSPEMNSMLYRLFFSKKTDEAVLDRRIRAIDKVLTLLTAGMIAVSLIRVLVVYSSLPDEMGVHFLGMRYITEKVGIKNIFGQIFHGGVQEYDVTGRKLWVFYPHLISFLAFIFSKLVLLLFGKLSKKESTDIHIKTKLKQALTLSLDIAVLSVCIYFCVIWVHCVMRQVGMRMIFTSLYIIFICLPLFELIYFSLMVNCQQKKDSKI